MIYLDVFKKYALLKMRMKIGFHALVQEMTVKELFCKSIQNTYWKLVKHGLHAEKRLVDYKFFDTILKGRANMKLVAF